MDRNFHVGSDYNVVDVIGEGAYGVVWCVLLTRYPYSPETNALIDGPLLAAPPSTTHPNVEWP